MTWLADGRALPPNDGDVWKLFFGRFEKLELGGTLTQPQPAWCWNKHGTADTHLPERFTQVKFSTKYVDEV